MPTVIVKTNPLHGSALLLKDLGVQIPASGGTETFTNEDEILQLQGSRDLLFYLADGAYPAGGALDGTLLLNNGSIDIPSADAEEFLATALLPASGAFSVVMRNEDGEVDQNIVFDGTATVTNLLLGGNLDLGSNSITNLASGTNPTDAVNKSQLDAVSASAKVWKELIVSCDQLDSANDALSQAAVFYLDGQPAANDTFIISDGVTTETFTFKAALAVAFDVLIGASADDTMDNLVTAINTDSTLWAASASSNLQSINDGSGSSTAGKVVVLRRANQALDSYDDRIYGSLTTPANGQYVNYNGETDYEKVASSQLPSGDPLQKEFGVGRTTASLVANESHVCMDMDTVYTWDVDGGQWQNTGAAGMQFSSGLQKSGTLVTPDYGLVGDVTSLAAAAAAGTTDKPARADHAHTHGDRGGDGAVSQHDADQVDVEGTYASLPNAPGSLETILGDINANFTSGALAGKYLQFGTTLGVPGTGTRYLESAGSVVASSASPRMLRNGTVTGASIEFDVGPGGNTYKLSIIKNNTTEIASITGITGAGTGATSTSLNGAFVATDTIGCSLVRTGGSGASAFDDVAVILEVVNS